MNALLESNKEAVANAVVEIHNGNEYHFVQHVDWLVCVKIVNVKEQGVCRLSSVYEDAITSFDAAMPITIIKEQGVYTVSSDLNEAEEHRELSDLKLIENYGLAYFQTLVPEFTERAQSGEFESEEALVNAMFDQFQMNLKMSDRFMNEIKKAYAKGE